MKVIIVRFQVKPEFRDEFVAIAKVDANGSVSEPGCRRFDILEDTREPNTFFFYEVYTGEDALKAHQATAHYAQYKLGVKPEWLAAPTVASHCTNLFPTDADWK